MEIHYFKDFLIEFFENVFFAVHEIILNQRSHGGEHVIIFSAISEDNDTIIQDREFWVWVSRLILKFKFLSLSFEQPLLNFHNIEFIDRNQFYTSGKACKAGVSVVQQKVCIFLKKSRGA